MQFQWATFSSGGRERGFNLGKADARAGLHPTGTCLPGPTASPRRSDIPESVTDHQRRGLALLRCTQEEPGPGAGRTQFPRLLQLHEVPPRMPITTPA